MKNLKQISVIGMGLLGGSITLAVIRSGIPLKTVGYSHRKTTRDKARRFGICHAVTDDLQKSVAGADIVVLATPILTFESIFREIAGVLKKGCVVTDVGSTKVLPHRWAKKYLPKNVYYAGSHPIAGSEKRGVEFARDDLFAGAQCIITKNASTNADSVKKVKWLWKQLGCKIHEMSPAEHDRIYARVSHTPHVVAAALINANGFEELKYCGKGFIDTSRIASGPVNVWADILSANADNAAKGIDKVIKELMRLKKAVKSKNTGQIKRLLEKARAQRARLIDYKLKTKELFD